MTSNGSSWFKRHPLIPYFVIAYAVSWGFMIPVALRAQGIIKLQVPYSLYYFASVGPAISAILVTALTEGGAGLRNLLGRVMKWRVDVRYYAFAVLAPISLFTVAILANRFITGTWSDLQLLGQADYLPVAAHDFWLEPVL